MIWLNGKKIISSDLCTITVAVKRSRNKRIQKKFIKKFGYKHIPSCMESNEFIIMHHDIFNKFMSLSVPQK